MKKIILQPNPNDYIHRCSRCLLSDSFPFIKFDENGVCNYCEDYVPYQLKGKDKLSYLVESHRSLNGEPDCIVGSSGGRDSSYMLHYLKKELGMNPIAFTYDWGMITDVARRNQARICEKLGIEHILISADINKKLENIRKNIKAWLKKPDLGMIPIFMAGDKQFKYFAHKLMKKTGIDLLFTGTNIFERTGFKLGFCGIKDDGAREKGILSGISFLNKFKLFIYYGMQYLSNPAYINSSLFDTLYAFYSSYIFSIIDIYIYYYIQWDETKIMNVLRKEYDWEGSSDTDATWRIGDGTAAFYNYIYYTVAGFTEFDTFRSNQIREGMITREQGLKLIKKENLPRFDSLEWYSKTIGFDLEYALDVIHSMKKIYNVEKNIKANNTH